MFRSERMNPVPQCPPRLDVQMLTPVIWSRMPNHFLNPRVGRISERLGWVVECVEPLIMMALHIPEENRWVTRQNPDQELVPNQSLLPEPRPGTRLGTGTRPDPVTRTQTRYQTRNWYQTRENLIIRTSTWETNTDHTGIPVIFLSLSYPLSIGHLQLV